MNIIFMRHGEATDNVKEILSDREIYWSVLTKEGKEVVKNSIASMPSKIDKIYVSPMPRTIETASYVSKKYPKVEVIIDKRIQEINHGKYSGLKNNEELDETRIKQIAGDYFVRLGQYGENNYDIESRICEFLYDVYRNNFKDSTILIVSHGSITSYMKRILNIKSPHIKTGKIEEFFNIDFSFLFKHKKKLKNIKSTKIKERVTKVQNLKINENLKKQLIKLCKEEFNNIEYSDEYFDNFMEGLNTKRLKVINDSKFDKGIILICFYNNFENLVEKFMNHYIGIGIKNFVLIDNNSTDDSTNILKSYSKQVHISLWKIDEMFNCYKMSGWKQQIMEFYGPGKQYLTVDSDELFIYKGYKNTSLEDFVKKEKASFIKTMMLDVYSNKTIFSGTLEDFKYVDKGTYRMTNAVPYKQRFYGGPRSRIFGINPSLQKIPFITYSGKEVYVNDHYYYPWNINEKAKFCSFLLHYKFLPDDIQKYKTYIKDGRHWNNSHEYKTYNNAYSNNNKLTFYDENISIPIDEIDFLF